MWVSKRAEDGVVEIVDRLVALADPHRGLGVALDEGVEHVVDHLGRDPRHFREQRHAARSCRRRSSSGTRLAMFLA